MTVTWYDILDALKSHPCNSSSSWGAKATCNGKDWWSSPKSILETKRETWMERDDSLKSMVHTCQLSLSYCFLMLTVPPSGHLRTDWRLCAGWWVRTRNGTGSGELRRKAKRWRSRSVRTCKDLQAKNKSCKCDFNTKQDHELRWIMTY